MKNIIPRKYFEVWADEQAQNSILKGLLAFLTLMNIALIISLTILASKKPLLISQNKSKTQLIHITHSIPKDFIKNEIKQSITRFIQLRHNWNDKTIDSRLKKSAQFIATQFKAKFFRANLENIKTAKTKKITQKFYISKEVKIDPIKKEALITGDRILIVEGLRATQPMTFKLNYQFGERGGKNPEGVYITKETLISTLTH